MSEEKRGRGRPAGAKNKPKEASAGVGHNGGGLSADQSAAILVPALAKYRSFMAEMEGIKGKLRNIRKQLKADLGMESWEVDYVLRIGKNKEEDEVKRRLREQELALWLQHPIGTQGDLLDGVDRRPADEKGFQEGKIAGLEGKDRVSPYSPSTPQGQAWLKGYDEGQKLAREGLQASMEAKNAKDEKEKKNKAKEEKAATELDALESGKDGEKPFTEAVKGTVAAGDKMIKDQNAAAAAEDAKVTNIEDVRRETSAANKRARAAAQSDL